MDHSGTTGKRVAPKAVLADANGASVTRIVTRAHFARMFNTSPDHAT
ncbi:hypothetical protein [Streptomyces sp. AC550_RSS872]|nr:hypothetical protein [Streptomyces sp. AC550_RSS872]